MFDRLGPTWTPDGLEQAHEKNGPVLLQNVAPTPLGTHEHSRVHFLIRAPRDGIYSLGKRFKAATRKERPCFAAECGLDRRGHTWTPDGLEQAHEKNGPVEHSRVHFLIRAPRDGVYSLGKRFKAATRKERPCFAAECGLDRRGHTWTPDGLEQAHEKNGPVLLQNVGPTPLGTHEHSRVHFSILSFRSPKQGVPKGLKQPHEKKGGDLEIGTWPRLNAHFMNRIW